MNVMQRAMHMLDCQDNVEKAIVAWADLMEVSRLEAARQVLNDSQDPEGQPVGYKHPWPDPDLIEAARKAVRKEQKS